MSDFSIDDVLSQFGSKTSSAKKKDFDVDSILKEFHGTTEEPKASAPVKSERLYVSPIKPPISGATKEVSDELNRRPETAGGDNPRSWLPTTDIQNKAYEADLAGKEMFSSGIEDLQTGHPYKGLGKAALGAFQRVTSPMSGIIEGGVSTPVADVTGNKDIGDRAGFVVGSALPVVPGAGAVVKSLPKNKALSTLVENIGPENLPAVVSAMKANPRLTPADLSPRVLQDTQHLFTQEGPQIDYLAKTSAARMAGRKDAIETAYDASGGVPPDLAQKITDLANASKKVGQERINPAVAGAGPVNVKPVIDSIDAILKPGVMSKVSEGSTLALPEVKQALASAKQLLTNGKETRTGAQDLHDIQKSLRRQSYNMMKSGNAGEREVGNALLNVRNKIVDAIDEASPRAGLNPVPEKFRDLKLNTPSGKTDETAVWFTKGDKPVYAQATENGAKQQLDAENFSKLSKFDKISGKDKNGNPITVWYKPGHEADAQKSVDNFTSGLKDSTKIEDKIKYHYENGKAYGYGDDAANAYVRQRFGDAEVDKVLGDKKPSGTYKSALEGYRDEMHIADAFKKGHDDIFTSSKKIENDPSFVKKWFDGLTDSEKQAAKEGARAAIYTEMGVAKNGALAGESVARSDFNKAKMEILFGKEEAGKLLEKLDAERAIANTHNKVVEGSQTAMRSASKSQFALPTTKEMGMAALAIPAMETANMMAGGIGGLATAGMAALKGGAMAKDAVKLALAKNHNAQYAKYALPTEGPSRDELIRALEARIPGPKQSMLSRSANALSKVIP